MKRRIVIIVSVIVLILVGIFGYFTVTNLQQEQALKKEMKDLSALVKTDNLDMDKINDRLKTTKTKGDYAKVEKAFKNYMSDFFLNITEMVDILEDKKLASILSIDNYREDGKDFVNTKQYISDTKKKLEEDKTKYYDFFEEKKIMSYIEKDNLSNRYKNLYRKEIIGDTASVTKDKTVETSINSIITLLDKSEKVIDFLVKNKDSWEVQNDKIMFNSAPLLTEYNILTRSLR